MVDKKIDWVDWGDGTQVEVQLLDLSGLGSTVCPTQCHPEENGEVGTGKVVTQNKKESKPKNKVEGWFATSDLV